MSLAHAEPINSTVFSIDGIDAAIWVLQQRPVAASGSGRICRVNPHGHARDVYSVLLEYADGVIHEHTGRHRTSLRDRGNRIGQYDRSV